ncbi:MAG TPA: LuxR C-terminal-related transcriptional regulator [Anaerolineales bacterium]|nr:LuxR C-terminal-related transcriptional regulator [Anaerolineales bacterium]
MVARARLIARLNEGLTRPLTLLSAPPGFGKTTLLGEWVGQGRLRAAWLVLDTDDNDPVRFWSYFIAALQQVDPTIGYSSLGLLQSPTAVAMESMLNTLVNEIDSFQADQASESIANESEELGAGLILVLDDYHVIETPAIHEQLSFLLEHVPPQMHLVISTRADPPLHLARLRARDQLLELHEADLRFTQTEAVQFLNDTMSLSLSAEQIAALERRTEGWIAGLQLAALSLRGREDSSGFVQAFTGSHRFVFDYLMDEVFARQTESTQSFLIQTSILERLNAALCNAVTGRADGQATLEELERNNLFLTALDDERHWYRYHQLFADVLLHRLTEKSPTALTEYHLRASEWFENEGSATGAVKHALAAHAWERAARLMDEAGESLRLRGEIATLTNWIQALPESVRRSHCALCLTYARGLINVGRYTEAEAFVLEADRWLEGNVQSNDVELDSLRGKICTLRAEFANTRNEYTQAIELAQRAEQLLPLDDVSWRSGASLILAGALRFTSHWLRANETFQEAATLKESIGDYSNAVFALSSRGEGLEAIGKLRQAAQQFEEVLQLAHVWHVPNIPVTGHALIGLGRVRYEWNELETAMHNVQTGLERGQQAGNMDVLLRGYHARAHILQAQGDIEGALTALDEADAVADKMGVAQVKNWISAWRAQAWLARGETEAALDWASHLVGPTHEAVFPSVQIALAKVWLSQRETDKALALLDRALQSTQAVGRLGNAIHILAVQAVAYHAQGQPDQAFATLEHALELAEPEGYVRVFVDEGVPMVRLLRRMMTRSPASEYVRRLLEALGESATTEMPIINKLVESLSQRELEVLRLIVEGATNKEIADELVLTINTVKRHISNIFGKLHVSNRAQAIARAREQNLL